LAQAARQSGVVIVRANLSATHDDAWQKQIEARLQKLLP
jgi:hypothetical protein